jgi:hypothetical protein
MKPTVERVMSGRTAVSMAVLWAGLSCSTRDAIDLGGDNGDGGVPEGVSLPCTAVDSDRHHPDYEWNVWDATKSRAVASPVENLVGVASDQTGLWLLSASWNVPDVKLVHYDVTTGASTDPFPVYGLFDTPGTGASALEVDSRYFWVGLMGNDAAIVRIDRSTGQVKRLPGVEAGGSSDFAWLGHDLLVTTLEANIDAFTPLPSWNRRRFITQRDSGRDYNVATCGDAVVIGGDDNGAGIVGPDPDKTGAAGFIGTNGDLTGGLPTHGSICFYGNQLVVADADGLTFYDLSPRPPP